MPLISTLGVAGAQAFGNRGLRYGGSAFFNAVGDYLTVPLNAAFTHTGNFTAEMWVYPTNLSVLNLLWRQSGAVYLWISPSGQVAWYHGSNPWSFSAATVTVNQWNHIAVVRNAGTITIYVNGVGSGSVFNTATVVTGINPLIGTWDGSQYQFFGYLTNLRIAKQALYTSDFIPSGIPLTVSSQGSTTTQLLLSTKTPSTLVVDSSANNFALSNVSVTYADFTPFLQPYVTPPVVLLQSATVTPTTTTPLEGDTITFNVVGSNTPNGTYYYTIEEDIATGAVTSADFTSGALSGSFTINGNNGTFPLTVSRDLLTEGTEEFVVYVRTTSISGAILGTSGNIVITDSSLTPAFTVAPTDINEGVAGTFTVQNIGSDGTYFFTVLNSTTSNADFSATSGSFVVSGSTGGLDNGTGSFSITPIADRTTEGPQFFQVQVRSGSTSGTIILTSGSITVIDTSPTPGFISAPSSINEGESGNFQVNNLGPAGTYYWTILNVTTVDADFSPFNGFFVTGGLNGTGSFDVTPTADRVTEGAQTFRVQVRDGSITGTVLATSPLTVTINDTSLTPTLTASSTQIRESTIQTSTIPSTVNFTATNLGPAGTYWWTINQPAPFGSYGRPNDFSGGLIEGSFTTTSLNQSVVIPIAASAVDVTEELTLPFNLSVRSNTNAGPIVVTSSNLSFLDCSIVTTITVAGFGTTTVNEGQQYDLTFKTGPGTPGGSYYWEIVNNTTTNADFVTLAGTVNLAGLGATTTIPATFLVNGIDGAEAGELFNIRVRHLNASGEIYGLSANFIILSNTT